mmetsp:Transcript_116811/g.229121  ORF Transcript_116811/g.229121 Transcript_116811/m.229121 type:complete len:176 (-) Transcript_116811:3-530(-)
MTIDPNMTKNMNMSTNMTEQVQPKEMATALPTYGALPVRINPDTSDYAALYSPSLYPVPSSPFSYAAPSPMFLLPQSSPYGSAAGAEFIFPGAPTTAAAGEMQLLSNHHQQQQQQHQQISYTPAVLLNTHPGSATTSAPMLSVNDNNAWWARIQAMKRQHEAQAYQMELQQHHQI